MPEVIVFKDEFGKLAGHGEKGGRAFARFQKAVRELEFGQTMRFSFKLPRSVPFHRRHFAVLNQVFEHQDQFVEEEAFRMWVQVGAGFCDLLPGPRGKPVAIPKSISFEAMDDVQFSEHHASVINFLRTRHATRFLWPDLNDAMADDMIESLLNEFM